MTTDKQELRRLVPRMYAPTLVEFWGLRASLGAGGSVIFDNDARIQRRCMRVRTDAGWKWQICGIARLLSDGLDGHAAEDQICLDEAGMDCAAITVVKPAIRAEGKGDE